MDRPITAPMRSQLRNIWSTARRVALLAVLLVTAPASAFALAVVGGAGALASRLQPAPTSVPLPQPYRPLGSAVAAVASGAGRIFAFIEGRSSPLSDRIRRLDSTLASKL